MYCKPMLNKLDSEKIALKASADTNAEKIYWFINNRLVGETAAGQIIEAHPVIGANEIKAVDNLGRASVIKITAMLAD